MTMDLYGKAPENDSGRMFSANVYWWSPLVRLAHGADSKAARRCPGWWTNDGQGLDRTDARTLGRTLRRAVENGAVEETARENGAVWKEGYETRHGAVPAHWETADERGRPHNGMNRDKTLEFAGFLESCGGFEIW